jgi:hypothetical protein
VLRIQNPVGSDGALAIEVRMKFGRVLLSVSILFWGFSALGQEDFRRPGSDGAPTLVSEEVEPEVTIVERDDGVVVEYRVEGQLYMVKVVPVSGPSYYLLDLDGDGVLDVQENATPDLRTPQWLLFSW